MDFCGLVMVFGGMFGGDGFVFGVYVVDGGVEGYFG